MSTSFHVRPPEDITLPKPGSTTVRELLSTYLRLQFRSLVTLPLSDLGRTDTGGPFVQQMRALAKSDPGLLFTLLRKPTIGGLVRLIVMHDGSREEMGHWAREVMAQMNFELATASRAEGTYPVEGSYDKLISLQRGLTLHLPEDTESVAFDGSVVTVKSGSGETRHDMAAEAPEGTVATHHPILDRIMFATVDNNPRADMEAHPDKEGNPCDLGEKSVDEWVGSLREAFDLVEKYTPALVPEMDLLIHQMIPVGFEPEKHLSASLMEVIGDIYLSLHPNSLVMAEAVIHEFSHNKINVLWSLAPLLENPFEPLFSSPVRPDPRPLFGVLLAVHAFLPVESLYVAMEGSGHPQTKHPRFAERRLQIRRLMADGCKTVLDNGVWTTAGEPVAEELRALDERFAATV